MKERRSTPAVAFEGNLATVLPQWLHQLHILFAKCKRGSTLTLDVHDGIICDTQQQDGGCDEREEEVWGVFCFTPEHLLEHACSYERRAYYTQTLFTPLHHRLFCPNPAADNQPVTESMCSRWHFICIYSPPSFALRVWHPLNFICVHVLDVPYILYSKHISD